MKALSIGERCPVFSIDLYLSQFPQLLDKIWLLKPEATFYDSTKPWFLFTPIGRNALAQFVENMCVDANLEKTKCTGHRSDSYVYSWRAQKIN